MAAGTLYFFSPAPDRLCFVYCGLAELIVRKTPVDYALPDAEENHRIMLAVLCSVVSNPPLPDDREAAAIRGFLKIYDPITDELLQRISRAVQQENGGPIGFSERWSNLIGPNIKDVLQDAARL